MTFFGTDLLTMHESESHFEMVFIRRNLDHIAIASKAGLMVSQLDKSV